MLKKILLSSLLAVLAVTLSACGMIGRKASEKTAENMAEKAIETSSGGQADVDIDGDNVNIKTTEGEMQAGESVELPANFPKDVYVLEGGKIKAAIQSNKENGYTITIETDKTINEIKEIYEGKFVTDGWKITGSMAMEGTISVVAEKDERVVSVIGGKGDENNSIVLTVTDK
jgi:hypothetical protein